MESGEADGRPRDLRRALMMTMMMQVTMMTMINILWRFDDNDADHEDDYDDADDADLMMIYSVRMKIRNKRKKILLFLVLQMLLT